MAIEDVFLIDHSFRIERLSDAKKQPKCIPLVSRKSKWKPANHTFCVSNLHTTWHLRAKNSQQERQFFESIQYMAKESIWSRRHPFDSYAPIRHYTSVSWFVDGRDYFWEVSLALESARESIYIHDWWLVRKQNPKKIYLPLYRNFSKSDVNCTYLCMTNGDNNKNDCW